MGGLLRIADCSVRSPSTLTKSGTEMQIVRGLVVDLFDVLSHRLGFESFWKYTLAHQNDENLSCLVSIWYYKYNSLHCPFWDFNLGEETARTLCTNHTNSASITNINTIINNRFQQLPWQGLFRILLRDMYNRVHFLCQDFPLQNPAQAGDMRTHKYAGSISEQSRRYTPSNTYSYSDSNRDNNGDRSCMNFDFKLSLALARLIIEKYVEHSAKSSTSVHISIALRDSIQRDWRSIQRWLRLRATKGDQHHHYHQENGDINIINTYRVTVTDTSSTKPKNSTDCDCATTSSTGTNSRSRSLNTYDEDGKLDGYVADADRDRSVFEEKYERECASEQEKKHHQRSSTLGIPVLGLNNNDQQCSINNKSSTHATHTHTHTIQCKTKTNHQQFQNLKHMKIVINNTHNPPLNNDNDNDNNNIEYSYSRSASRPTGKRRPRYRSRHRSRHRIPVPSRSPSRSSPSTSLSPFSSSPFYSSQKSR